MCKDQPKQKPNQSPKNTSSSISSAQKTTWTKERMLKAKPMPMPTVSDEEE